MSGVRKVSKKLLLYLSGVICILICVLLFYKCKKADSVTGLKTGIEEDKHPFASGFAVYLSSQVDLPDDIKGDLQRLQTEDRPEELLEEKSDTGETGGAYTVYEKYFRLKQGELVNCMNFRNADELGTEGFLNSHFGGITIRISDGVCVQYSNIGNISEELLPRSIIIDDGNMDLGFMEARAGMDFLEIQDNAYETEVKEGFMYNEAINVYYLEFADDFYTYLFLSYYPDGRDSWLIVEKQ